MEETKFVVGSFYQTRSLCDYECIFSYEVIKRTSHFVTLKDSYGITSKRHIRIRNNIEFVYPEGQYSMCPVLTADKAVT